MRIDVEDETTHVLLLLEIHPGHRLVEQQQVGLHGEGAAELDPLLQTVGELADLNLADMLNLQKIDDLLDAAALLDLFRKRRSDPQELPEEAAAHLQRPARHDVVERRHSLEQRHVLKGAGDAAERRLIRPHRRSRPPLEGDAALLRVIEAVDDVEQRSLAGPVRTDNGADLAFANVERDIADGLDAAEGERNILDREHHLAGRDIGPARRPHATTLTFGWKKEARGVRCSLTPLSPLRAPARSARRGF